MSYDIWGINRGLQKQYHPKFTLMGTRGPAWLLVMLAAVLVACSGSNSPPSQNMFEQAVREVLHYSIVQVNTNAATGSGIVFDSKGDIVTNAHVVKGARTIQVLRNVGAPLQPARVIGVSQKNDLAVIHVQTGADTLRPARFGNSDSLQIGQYVLAMGDPLGLTDSVTQGIISSADRRVAEKQSGAVLTVIQTSAAINPGNSGGGLVDLNGNVIGMPTLSVYDPQSGGTAPGIGFAIPSNTITTVASQLISHGR